MFSIMVKYPDGSSEAFQGDTALLIIKSGSGKGRRFYQRRLGDAARVDKLASAALRDCVKGDSEK